MEPRISNSMEGEQIVMRNPISTDMIKNRTYIDAKSGINSAIQSPAYTSEIKT